MVERRPEEPGVGGSSPPDSTSVVRVTLSQEIPWLSKVVSGATGLFPQIELADCVGHLHRDTLVMGRATGYSNRLALNMEVRKCKCGSRLVGRWRQPSKLEREITTRVRIPLTAQVR